MNPHRTIPTLILAALVCATSSSQAAESHSFTLTVSAGKHNRANVPVRVLVDVPKKLSEVTTAAVTDADGKRTTAKVTAPSLLAKMNDPAEGCVGRELHFVLPKLQAGQSQTLSATISPDVPPSLELFRWTETEGRYTELSFGKRPVLRYMHEKLDESTAARREETYKVFHHVFDPTGETVVTKGPGGRYSHHRGLFYGFNKVNYVTEDGKAQSCDIWHCRNAHQSHLETLAKEEGPVLGRHRVLVGWHGPDKQIFAKEERELSVYNTPGGTLIEFASRLRPNEGVAQIKLDGDPQHAGFHFRASDEVASQTSKQTYYLRPDGKDKLGATRNWPGNRQHVNLPWNAMSFVVGGQRYTCCYIDRPQNPKEARFSERDYGRFGSYFQYDLSSEKTLDLNYRIWLQSGEMNEEQVHSLSNDFVEPTIAKIET